MIYSIKIDGITVYDEDEQNIVFEPDMSDELNVAGSLTFKMPYNHQHYDVPKELISDVEVYERDELIWFGRITKIKVDWDNAKEISCVGALSFLNDSIQRPVEFPDDDLVSNEFFRYLIEEHNTQVPANRQFIVGQVDIENKIIYRKLDYETTFSAINTMCLDAEGGYLFVRKVDGKNYIDWLSEVPYVADQEIQFGVNLRDMSQTFDYADFFTCIIPLGDEDEESGQKVTCADANDGYDYILSDAAETYGQISTVVTFDGLKKPIDVYDAGVKYLEDKQFDPLTIEVNAAELSFLNDDYTAFKVGQKVHVTSTPHLIDKTYPILKIDINLDEGTKEITIGNVKPKELEEIYKDS